MYSIKSEKLRAYKDIGFIICIILDILQNAGLGNEAVIISDDDQCELGGPIHEKTKVTAVLNLKSLNMQYSFLETII